MTIRAFLNRHELGLLPLAAMLTWGVVGAVVLLVLNQQSTSLLAWWAVVVALTVYLLAMLGAIWGECTGPPMPIRRICLTVMPLSVLLISWHVHETVQLIYLVIFAGVLPFYLTLGRSLVVVLLANAGVTVLLGFRWNTDHLLISSGLYLTFQLFSLFSSRTAFNEREVRSELAVANQQLEAAQSLLTKAAKQEERLRIARDLHDVLGHHLTGLSLQLEVARHHVNGKPKQHIEEAQALTKLLLADVRQVVADSRKLPEINLCDSLKQLAESARGTVKLELPKSSHVDSTGTAEGVFRVVQEIITNHNKHSASRALSIALYDEPNRWILESREACRQSLQIIPGNGLIGMRERIEQLGGTLKIETSPELIHRVVIPKT